MLHVVSVSVVGMIALRLFIVIAVVKISPVIRFRSPAFKLIQTGVVRLRLSRVVVTKTELLAFRLEHSTQKAI